MQNESRQKTNKTKQNKPSQNKRNKILVQPDGENQKFLLRKVAPAKPLPLLLTKKCNGPFLIKWKLVIYYWKSKLLLWWHVKWNFYFRCGARINPPNPSPISTHYLCTLQEVLKRK